MGRKDMEQEGEGERGTGGHGDMMGRKDREI